MSGSRGEANFVWKCTLCKRESSISESVLDIVASLEAHSDAAKKTLTTRSTDQRPCTRSNTRMHKNLRRWPWWNAAGAR